MATKPVFFHEGDNPSLAQPGAPTGNAAQDWLNRLLAEFKARGEDIVVQPGMGGMYQVTMQNPKLRQNGQVPGGSSFMVDPLMTRYTPADWATGQIAEAYRSLEDMAGLGTLGQPGAASTASPFAPGVYMTPPSKTPPSGTQTPSTQRQVIPGGQRTPGGQGGQPTAPQSVGISPPSVGQLGQGVSLVRSSGRAPAPPEVGVNAENGDSFPVIGGGQEPQIAQQVAPIQRVPGLQQIMQAANPYSMAAFGLRRR